MQQRFARELGTVQVGKPLNVSSPGERRTDAAIGETCRTLRMQAGLSLSRMAELTNRDTSTLSRFERGHTKPRDVDDLVRAYRRVAGPAMQQRPQRSDRPRMWPLVYLAASPIALTSLMLAGPAAWDSHVARGWATLSLVVIVCTVLPTLLTDARQRHPIALVARAGYLAALGVILTGGVLSWNREISPILFVQVVVVVAFGMIAIAYDRLDTQNAPAE